MDRHTIRQLKQEVPENGERHSERLVYVEPEMRLDDVVRILIEKHCSMAPIVTPEEGRKVNPKVDCRYFPFRFRKYFIRLRWEAFYLVYYVIFKHRSHRFRFYRDR